MPTNRPLSELSEARGLGDEVRSIAGAVGRDAAASDDEVGGGCAAVGAAVSTGCSCVCPSSAAVTMKRPRRTPTSSE